MNFKTVPLFELVRLIDLWPVGQTLFCILVRSPAETSLVPELQRELELQTGRQLEFIDSGAIAPSALIERIRASDAPVVVLSGLEAWSDDNFVVLDVNRTRLKTGRFVVFCVDPSTAARLLDRAPNLRSAIGTAVLAVAPDRSLMTAEQIAERLRQLKEYYQMSDVEVVARAERGTLPPEPHFTEWLVLLGRGDLGR